MVSTACQEVDNRNSFVTSLNTQVRVGKPLWRWRWSWRWSATLVSPEHGFAFKTETGDVLNGTEATRITTSTFVWHLSGVDFGLLFLFLLSDLSFPCGYFWSAPLSFTPLFQWGCRIKFDLVVTFDWGSNWHKVNGSEVHFAWSLQGYFTRPRSITWEQAKLDILNFVK